MAGFLEKLWDETIAGPTPDLVNRRIRNLQSHRSISSSDGRTNLNSDPVSRTITLLRTRSLSAGSGSDPSSPTLSSPRTPGTPREDTKRLTRKKAPVEDADSTTPTDYHWILISALDR